MNHKLEPRRFKIELLPWLVMLIMALLLVGIFKQAMRWYNISSQIEAEKEVRAALLAENDNLRETMKYVSSSTYTEEQARLRFGLVKPGEKLAVVPRVAGATDSNTEGNSVIAELSATWQQWWAHFFK